MVSAGFACTFTMEGEALMPGQNDSVLYFPVEFPLANHSIVAVYRKEAYLPKCSSLFIENARECFANAREEAQKHYLPKIPCVASDL